MAWLFTCGPLGAVLIAWVITLCSWRRRRPVALTVVALLLVTGNAALSATCYLRASYHLTTLPPWQDPVNLDAGLLTLLAPLGMLVTAAARWQGAPKWLVMLLETVSLPLFVVGCAAAASV